jgi:hypothetical protein
VTHLEASCTFVGVKSYTLLGPDRRSYQSITPGTWGGHRQRKVYGRLDCPSAVRWIAKGHYVQHRVSFVDEEVAIAAGYRALRSLPPAEVPEMASRPRVARFCRRCRTRAARPRLTR